MPRPIPFHPLLAAMAPVLLLLSTNVEFVSPTVAVRPVLILIAAAIAAWLLLGLATRSASKAATLTTIGVLAVTLTGQIISMLPPAAWIEQPVTVLPRQFVGAVLVMLWVAALFLAVRTRRPERTTRPLNVALACLVAVPLLNIAYHQITAQRGPMEVGVTVEEVAAVHRPDIFFIMPDAYARADVLADIYDYDNSDFLAELASLGFRVSGRSRSNYCQTTLSAASTLNMDYLDGIAGAAGDARGYREAAHRLLRNSETTGRLRGAGYELVAFNSGYRGTSLPDADRYIVLTGDRSEFERVFWSMVILPFRAIPFVDAVVGLDAYDDHAARITGTLDLLPTVRQSEAPVFVFAHIISPHPPFIFDADGQRVRPDYSFRYGDADMIIPEYISRRQYIRDYIAQLQYLNRRLLQTVRAIKEASTDPCIIIIQSDHGARSQLVWEDPEPHSMIETFAILNAYHVPEQVEERLYDEITPVNTFRLVLNYCLGLDMPLLEDRSYFSTWSRPYDFIDVTDLTRAD